MMKNFIVIIVVKTLLVKSRGSGKGNGYLNKHLLNCKEKNQLQEKVYLKQAQL